MPLFFYIAVGFAFIFAVYCNFVLENDLKNKNSELKAEQEKNALMFAVLNSAEHAPSNNQKTISVRV